MEGTVKEDIASVKQGEDARNKGTIRKQERFLINNKKKKVGKQNWSCLSVNRWKRQGGG